MRVLREAEWDVEESQEMLPTAMLLPKRKKKKKKAHEKRGKRQPTRKMRAMLLQPLHAVAAADVEDVVAW